MRLFIAIELSEEIKKRLERISEMFRMSGVTLVKREAYHITLHFLGEVSEAHAKSLTVGLEALEKPAAFTIRVRGLSAFGMPLRVVFADMDDGKEQAIGLYRITGEAVKRLMPAYPFEENYTPHITLARIKHAEKELIHELVERYSGMEFGTMDVNAFVLKKSMLAKDGPIYTDICRCSLIGH